MQEKKEIEERVKHERHESLKKKIEQKHEWKKVEEEQRNKEKEKFASFLEEYKNKKPLYRKYEERYHKKFVQEDNRKRLDILSKIKEERSPLDMSDIKDHM